MIDTLLINIVSPIFASGFTWILARRKFKQEVKANEIENIEKIISIWRTMVEELEDRLKQAQNEIVQLTTEITSLRQQLFNK